SDTIRTHQIQMGSERVMVFTPREFTILNPLHIERDHSSLRKIDAAFLLVLGGFSNGSDVPVHVQDRGYFPCQILRLIENRCGVEARNNLVAELSGTISGSIRDGSQHFETWRRGNPILGPTMEDNIIEKVLTDSRGLDGPFLRALRESQWRDTLHCI